MAMHKIARFTAIGTAVGAAQFLAKAIYATPSEKFYTTLTYGTASAISLILHVVSSHSTDHMNLYHTQQVVLRDTVAFMVYDEIGELARHYYPASARMAPYTEYDNFIPDALIGIVTVRVLAIILPPEMLIEIVVGIVREFV